jgi:hypothetical protein
MRVRVCTVALRLVMAGFVAARSVCLAQSLTVAV